MVIVLKVLSSYLTLKSSGCLYASEYRHCFTKILYCSVGVCVMGCRMCLCVGRSEVQDGMICNFMCTAT